MRFIYKDFFFLIKRNGPLVIIIKTFEGSNFIVTIIQSNFMRVEKLTSSDMTKNYRLVNAPELKYNEYKNQLDYKTRKTYIVVLLIILVILFNHPDIIFISILIITETRNFLLTRDGTFNLMRVEVSTISNVLETNLILESNFITSLFFSYSGRKNDPGAVIIGRSLSSEDLSKT